jgi:exodeoxyribonuclease VII small subunit
LRTQQEPDIDNLTTIVSESLAAHKVCKERIDAVEKALEQSLGTAQLESEPGKKTERSPSASPGPLDSDDDVPF